jgi:hypothetical protein
MMCDRKNTTTFVAVMVKKIAIFIRKIRSKVCLAGYESGRYSGQSLPTILPC